MKVYVFGNEYVAVDKRAIEVARDYDAHACAGPDRGPNGLLVDHLDGPQEIDRVVHALQDLDGRSIRK
jgi:hypothetical protein